jgi:hypothetical protein
MAYKFYLYFHLLTKTYFRLNFKRFSKPINTLILFFISDFLDAIKTLRRSLFAASYNLVDNLIITYTIDKETYIFSHFKACLL